MVGMPGGLADPGRRMMAAALPATALALAFVLVLVAAAFGGSPLAALIDLPSVLIVLGGTAAATAASFDLADLAQLGRSLRQAIGGPRPERLLATKEAGLALAATAQREGLLAIERRLDLLADLPVLRRGLRLAIDGMGGGLERTLEPEVEAAAASHLASAAILRRAAEVAPATGLIGTLIGLVGMLGSLERPEAVGGAMAVALLTTLYGALLAHLLLLPLAERVSRLAAEETRLRRLEQQLACAIAAGEGAARLRERLGGQHGPAPGRPAAPWRQRRHEEQQRCG